MGGNNNPNACVDLSQKYDNPNPNSKSAARGTPNPTMYPALLDIFDNVS